MASGPDRSPKAVATPPARRSPRVPTRLPLPVPAVAVAALLGVAGTAQARDCRNPATQPEATACSQDRLRGLDAELNRVYREVVRRLGGAQPQWDLLTAAESQWIRFRDAECAFAASAAQGGSAAPMVVADCKAELTDSRIRGLRAYLSCEEGDLGCALPPR